MTHINEFIDDSYKIAGTHATRFPDEAKGTVGASKEFWESIDTSFAPLKTFLSSLSIDIDLDDLDYVSRDLQKSSMTTIHNEKIYTYGDMRQALHLF